MKSIIDSLNPFDYHTANCGERGFETMESTRIHRFHPIKETEEDYEEEVTWRAQRELDDWVD